MGIIIKFTSMIYTLLQMPIKTHDVSPVLAVAAVIGFVILAIKVVKGMNKQD